MNQISVTLPDGSSRSVPAGTPVRDVAEGISPNLARAALAAVVDGRLVDLSYPLQKDGAVRIVTDKSPEGLPLYRHSTAHLLAAAVTNLFPGTQCGIGPATDEGFFYDFVVERPFVPEDLELIEKKMKELAAQDLPYERQLLQIEEAKKRDHRKLGRDLGLFTFHQWAPGAAFWLDKGTTLYNLLANYMRDVLFPAGYVEVKTPLIYNKTLWERSGHWKHYRKDMFLIESEGETMSMKPMNCPGHFLAYASDVRSYRDLPIRFHEQTPLHRNEASGVLSGLTRVRQFSQDDAHCFLMQEQIGEEIERLIRLIQRIYGDFGLSFSAKLSTRPDEFLGEIATWDHAETQLRSALDSAQMAYTLNEKDGAFYGPKIDFDITDAIGRNWQCATIQLDYEQPQNFDLKYIGADNTEHRPVLIHRAIFGSFERFIAILIEHYAGAFPLWLAPVQAVMIPIADRHVEYCRQVRDRLNAAGLRVDIDSSLERMNAKIRNAQLQKIPYMLVVGDREQEQGAVAVRLRSGEDLKSKPVDEFLAIAREAINKKR